MEEDNVTIQEAADILHVRSERIWELLRDGVLTAKTSNGDGRQQLIARDRIEGMLREHDDLAQASDTRGDTGGARRRPWPNSIGMIADGTIPSSGSEEYLRQGIESGRSLPG